MQGPARIIYDPRILATVTGSVAVLAGVGFLQLQDAPSLYSATNVTAWLMGLGVVALAVWRGWRFDHNAVSLLMTAALCYTAIGGVSIDGVRRWLQLGPLLIQPAFVLLPLLTLNLVRRPQAWTIGCVMVAALALALQPDRALSAALAVSVLVLWLCRPSRPLGLAVLVGWAGLVATLVQADALQPVPLVEGVYRTAWQSGGWNALWVFGGTVVMFIPALLGLRRKFGKADQTMMFRVFGAVWLTLVCAAALGHYPTPLVGYGASAILGYALSIVAMPATAQRAE